MRRIGVGRITPQHRLEARDRLGVSVERLQRDAAVEMRAAVARPDRQRLLIGRDRIGVAAEAREREPAVEMQLGVRRIRRQQRVILRQRFIEPAQHGERIGAIGQDIGRAWLKRERRLEQPQRRRRIATLQLDDAQEMHHPVAVGRELADAPAELLGLGQLPLPQQLRRPREHAREFGRRTRAGCGHEGRE